jgi:hypothetical protein
MSANEIINAMDVTTPNASGVSNLANTMLVTGAISREINSVTPDHLVAIFTLLLMSVIRMYAH